MNYFGISWLWSFLLSAFNFSSKSSQISEQGADNFRYSELTIFSADRKSSNAIQSQNSPSDAYWQAIPRVLGFQFHKKKLVLDLDETLISSSQKHCLRHDISVQIYINGSYANFYVRKRPHVDQFLETVSQWFEVVIFTASLSVYANAVIDKLDPKGLINRRYFRQSCINKSGSYIKDLRTVCKDLSKVVIVDNSPVAYSCNKENGIAIPDYFGTNSTDKSLLRLIPLLEKVRDSEDVRHVLKGFPTGVCDGDAKSPPLHYPLKRSNDC